MPQLSPQCGRCIHKREMETGPIVDGIEGETRVMCEAFPEWPGIPDEIWRVEFDHRQPHAGDHGIQWAPAMPGLTHPKE